MFDLHTTLAELWLWISRSLQRRAAFCTGMAIYHINEATRIVEEENAQQ